MRWKKLLGDLEFFSILATIILNSRKPIFQDRNVRKAISLLFPYEFVNKIVNHGLLKQTFGPWDNSELSAKSDPSQKAKKILYKADSRDLIIIKDIDEIPNMETLDLKKIKNK